MSCIIPVPAYCIHKQPLMGGRPYRGIERLSFSDSVCYYQLHGDILDEILPLDECAVMMAQREKRFNAGTYQFFIRFSNESTATYFKLKYGGL